MTRGPVRALAARHSGSLPAAGFVLVVVGVFVLVRPGVLLTDTRPDLFLAPGRLLAGCFQSWVGDTGLGAPNFDVGYLPVAFFFWVTNLIGIPPWLGMRFWRILLFLLASAGAWRFTVANSGTELSRWARWTAAVAYPLSPYALVGAATTPIMLPMALLPWLVLGFQGCLRPGGWRRAPLFGIVMFLMAGINGGVVNAFMLLALPLVLIDAGWRHGRSWRTLIAGTAAAGGVALAVTLYWVVATGVGFASASTVAGTTESPEVVASTSSYAEVLRGMGGWLMYGRDVRGPFAPESAAYVSHPLVVLATFVLPVLATVGLLVSRSRGRVLAWSLLVLGAVVMVGMHPSTSPAPLGQALRWGFDNIPGFVAMRTTNKAGPLLVLGLALLSALAVHELGLRLSGARRGLLTVAVALGLAVPVVPALRADLLFSPLQVPDYWRTAAADLDARSGDGRVWLVPGETNASYRWRTRGIDDFSPALIERHSVHRRTYPDVPAFSANLLAAADNALQAGDLEPGVVPAIARYLGASDLLIRNDMMWETVDGARPAQLMTGLERDPGLIPSAIYGRPGTNVVSEERRGEDPQADAKEAQLAPLFRFGVDEPRSYARAESASGHVVVVGDNAGAVTAMAEGLLDGTQPYDLAGSLSPERLIEVLGTGGRVVLTDSNRRTAANDRSLGKSGPLLPEAADPGPTRAIFQVEDQTVAQFGDRVSITASASGSIFGPSSEGGPGLAFDHDPATAWTFGDFSTGTGARLSVDFGGVREVRRVRIVPQDSAPARIARVSLRIGTFQTEVNLLGGPDAVDVPTGTTARDLTLTVLQTSGDGFNQIGISEVKIDDLDLSQYARLPRTLRRLTGESPEARAAIRRVPLDVLFQRAVWLEGEPTMARRFDLPDSRVFEVSGQLGQKPTRDKADGRCLVLGRLDGVEVRASARRDDGRWRVAGCGAALRLDAGRHEFVADQDVVLDRLHLADVRGVADPNGAGARPNEAPQVSWSGNATAKRVEVGASDTDFQLVLAETYDSRWVASADGESLGPPVLADGYALSWRVPAGPPRIIEIRYAPQRWYLASAWFSLGSLAIMLMFTGVTAVRDVRRRVRSGVAS